VGRGTPPHRGRGLGSGLGPLSRPPLQKKMKFSLEMACFGSLSAVFVVRLLVTKMWNFQPVERLADVEDVHFWKW